jgi:hypothetical protein
MHEGFAQADKRYEITRAWWDHYLASLQSYLETGKGTPNAKIGAIVLTQDLQSYLETGKSSPGSPLSV